MNYLTHNLGVDLAHSIQLLLNSNLDILLLFSKLEFENVILESAIIAFGVR